MEQLALVLALALTVQRAGQEGTITGSLRLNGADVAMRHVYASVQPGFFDKTAEDVHVLFSDVPLPDDARANASALIALGRSGKARIVEVVIDAQERPISGSLFAPEFKGMVSASGMHAFTKDRLDRGTIAGRLVVTPEREFNGVRWSYDVRFMAPIPRPPTSSDLASQLASPPARAADAYLAAIRRGEMSPFLATMTTAAAADFRGATGASRLADLRMELPADAKVVELVPQTDGTVLAKVEGHARGIVIGYTLRMTLDAGQWKVTK